MEHYTFGENPEHKFGTTRGTVMNFKNMSTMAAAEKAQGSVWEDADFLTKLILVGMAMSFLGDQKNAERTARIKGFVFGFVIGAVILFTLTFLLEGLWRFSIAVYHFLTAKSRERGDGNEGVDHTNDPGYLRAKKSASRVNFMLHIALMVLWLFACLLLVDYEISAWVFYSFAGVLLLSMLARRITIGVSKDSPFFTRHSYVYYELYFASWVNIRIALALFFLYPILCINTIKAYQCFWEILIAGEVLVAIWAWGMKIIITRPWDCRTEAYCYHYHAYRVLKYNIWMPVIIFLAAVVYIITNIYYRGYNFQDMGGVTFVVWLFILLAISGLVRAVSPDLLIIVEHAGIHPRSSRFPAAGYFTNKITLLPLFCWWIVCFNFVEPAWIRYSVFLTGWVIHGFAMIILSTVYFEEEIEEYKEAMKRDEYYHKHRAF